MKLSKIFLSSVYFLTTTLFANVHAQNDGVRIANKDKTLKEIFPNFTRVEEGSMLPENYGGTSLLGLVSRLLGESISHDYEGLQVRRWTYSIYEKKNILGLCHGSRRGLNGESTIDVFVCYDPQGRIVKVFSQDGKTYSDFEGFQVQDFEVRRGKKGRVVGFGRAIQELRNPKDKSIDRTEWNSVFRAVKFNAAFMDVSYFITQHPDLSATGQLSAEAHESAPEAQFKAMEKGAKDGAPK